MIHLYRNPLIPSLARLGPHGFAADPIHRVEFALHTLAPQLIQCAGDARVKQTSRDVPLWQRRRGRRGLYHRWHSASSYLVTRISPGAFLASQIGKYSWRDIGVSGCISGLFTLVTAQISCSSVYSVGNPCYRCFSRKTASSTRPCDR